MKKIFRKAKANDSFYEILAKKFYEVKKFTNSSDEPRCSLVNNGKGSFVPVNSDYFEDGYYEQKQIPFDVNRIGELEVVTRDGRKVLDIATLKIKTEYPIIALVEGEESTTFSTNGVYRIPYSNPKDLFMLEYVPIAEEKEYVIDVYSVMGNSGYTTFLRPVDADATPDSKFAKLVKSIPIKL